MTNDNDDDGVEAVLLLLCDRYGGLYFVGEEWSGSIELKHFVVGKLITYIHHSSRRNIVKYQSTFFHRP